jgi:hypothetical protein
MKVAKPALAACAALCVIPGSAAADKPSQGCPPPFTLVTVQEAVDLPRSQAGIAAGAFTADDLIALFETIDANDDTLLCYQEVHGFEVSNRPLGQYFYNLVDNQASVPGG